MVAEIAEYKFAARTRSVFVCVLIIPEMADYAFPTRMRSAVLHYDGCGDGGICVFSVDQPV